MRFLMVSFDNMRVGRLWLNEHGVFLFQYEPAWLSDARSFPLSLRLPLRPEPFERDASKPFFVNLLPEADIRLYLASKLGISPGSDFKLLEAIGGDCAGALSVLPEEAVPDSQEGSYVRLPLPELDRMIDDMPRRPLLGYKDFRLSLAGAQNKLPVYFEDSKIFLPRGSFASSHILKPFIPRFEGTVENEAFCMKLARACGIDIPEVQILSTSKHIALLIQRFDRARDENGRIRRLHQEDFCQALGLFPQEKYESEGGPSLGKCFALLQDHSLQPAADKKKLLQWIVFNHLIGNHDAHGKNVALLVSQQGFRLAPFYDLMSTAVYEDLSDKMAMKIGGTYDPKGVFKRHWERLAVEAAVKPSFVLDLRKETTQEVLENAQKIAKELDETPGRLVVRRIIKTIKLRSSDLQ